MQRLYYTANIPRRGRRQAYRSAEWPTRDDAALEAFAANPDATECQTGYGYHGSFDMRWHKRADYSSQRIADARSALGARAFTAFCEG